MHTSIFLLSLAISTISSALPTTSAPFKRCITSPPTIYTMGRFTTFTPADGNPNPPTLYFTFYDSDTSTSTTCTSSGNRTAGVPIPCANPVVTFTYDGGSLKINETYTSCSSNETVTAQSTLGLSVYCYPIEPPVPSGYGTQCQTPTGQLTGEFDS